MTFDLSKFTTVTGGSGGLVPRWNTVTTGGDAYASYSNTYLSGKTVAVPLLSWMKYIRSSTMIGVARVGTPLMKFQATLLPVTSPCPPGRMATSCLPPAAVVT